MDYKINEDGSVSKAGHYPNGNTTPPPPPKRPNDNSGCWIIIAIIAIGLFFVFLFTW